jgi:ankyrin repeat protein
MENKAACNTGNPDIVRLLLQYGADTTFQGAGRLDNCLNAAVTNGHCKVVQILLDAGVSPNFVGDQAMPPILKVCFFYYRSDWPYDDVTKVLLEHGADPNAVVLADKALPDFPAFTPDSLRTLGDINAIQFANLAQSKMLLEKGADVNHQSQNGLYPAPLYYAVRKEDLELVNLLLENGESHDG